MQLLLVNSKKAVAITLVTGKNTGAMKTPAATAGARTARWGSITRKC